MEDLEGLLLPEPAPVEADPARVRDEPLLEVAHGGDGLQDLHGEVGEVRRERRRRAAVGPGLGADPAVGELVGQERRPVGAGAVEGDLWRRRAAVGLGRLRRALGEGLEDGALEDHAEDVPRLDGGRLDGMDDRSLRRLDADTPEQPLVVRDLGDEGALGREGAVGPRVLEDRVDRRPLLGRGPGEVEAKTPALDGQREVHREGLTVAVTDHVGAVGAVGQAPERDAEGPVARVVDGAGEAPEIGQPVVGQDGRDGPAALLVRRDLGAEIPQDLVGRPHVGADHVPQRGDGPARRHQLRGRDAESLLEDLGRAGSEVGPADVRHVGGVRHEGDQPPAV